MLNINGKLSGQSSCIPKGTTSGQADPSCWIGTEAKILCVPLQSFSPDDTRQISTYLNKPRLDCAKESTIVMSFTVALCQSSFQVSMVESIVSKKALVMLIFSMSSAFNVTREVFST